MKLYGLTGGIGMGKTTATEYLVRRGMPIVDTDVIARQVVEPGQPGLQEIREQFGAGVIAPDGTLRRAELARIVFADPEKRLALEAILHPRIRQIWNEQVGIWRGEGRRAAVVVIPLLFETGAASGIDATICLACTRRTQSERLRLRGWDDAQIQSRNQAQLPIEKKMASANYVIWSEGAVVALTGQLDRVLALGNE